MVLNIQTDSRKVKPGDTFVAIKGYTVDGHDFILKAIENGATTIVCNTGQYSVNTIHTEDTLGYLTNYLKETYADVLKDLCLIGITGTNGKTTSAMLLHDALNKLKEKTAYIGTVGFYIGKKVSSLINTTPDILTLYELLLTAHENGCKNVVLEVSSQGIANRRVEGLKFDYAVFTNLTQDHLDFHKTMGNYALAKQELFRMLKQGGKAIVNVDDSYKDYYLLDENQNITYGFSSGDYRASNMRITRLGTEFELRTVNQKEQMITPLIGEYNIYNLLVVIAILNQMGVSLDQIKKSVSNLKAPTGRMETLAYQDNSVVIDYAHTPDAIKKILDTMKGVATHNIYVVFGCTGNRDRLKRPIMTKIVTDNVTKAIITMDDPHEEDPNQIVADMIEGIEKDNYEIVLDRKEAICRGIDLLEHEDILLILGKGHEDVIIMKDKRIPFSDRDEVVKYLEQKITVKD